jgi:uncharacterized protein YcgL (UPF0745 family)
VKRWLDKVRMALMFYRSPYRILISFEAGQWRGTIIRHGEYLQIPLNNDKLGMSKVDAVKQSMMYAQLMNDTSFKG